MEKVKKTQVRYIKVLPRGQVTIPNDIRKALGIEEGGVLSLEVKGESIIMAPLRPSAKAGEALRSYTKAEIDRFLEEEKLDEETAKRVKKLLGIKG